MSRLGLSPEWDRWFDEEFVDLVTSDPDWLRAEFASLVTTSVPSDTVPGPTPPSERRIEEPDTP